MTEALLAEFGVARGMSPSTIAIVELLKAGKPGDVLTDAALTVACGRDTRPQGVGYANLQTAIGHVLKNHGVLWERERGANAIKCLVDREKVGSADKDRRHIQRKTKHAIRKLSSVDRKALTVSENSQVNAMTAQLSAVELFSRPETRKKLEAKQAATVPDVSKLIEQFS